MPSFDVSESVSLPVPASTRRSSPRALGVRVWTYWPWFVVTAALCYGIAIPMHRGFNVYLTVVWSLAFPITVLALWGLVASRRLVPSPWGPPARDLLIIQIPTIGRRDTLPALHRVVTSILHYVPEHFRHWRLDIVTEETAEALAILRERYEGQSQIRLVVIPTSYQCPRGSRYKARANAYALARRRNTGEDGPRIWTYHLDDDTAVGSDTVAALRAHITQRGARYPLAQGVLAFPHDLSPSWWTRLADSVRPIDDLSRFYFFAEVLRRPWAGLHGEHLLVRADVEDTIGWDFGPQCVVEDAYFGLRFAALYPGRSAFLPAYSYGASPATVGALVRQRARWAVGLLRLALDPAVGWRSKAILAAQTAYWALSLAQHLIIVLLIAALAGWWDTSPIWRPLAFVWSFNFSFWLWAYWQGFGVNRRVSQRPLSRWWQVLVVLLSPFLSLIEAWAAFRGLCQLADRQRGFDVIPKEH